VAADYTWKLGADTGVRFQTQYTHQKSVGAGFIGDFSTWSATGRIAASRRDATLWLAFSQTGEGAGIKSPYGSYPGYVSLMQSDFDRAGERAQVLGVSYAPRSLPGWSGFLQLARGDGGFDELTGRDNADEREIDLTVDWKIEEGRWRGFWLRLRGSMLDRDGSPSRAWQARIILNYVLPVL
jgi:hypothetical protein